MSSTPPGRRGADQPHNVAAAIAEVSERATLLVREEIELAKAEVAEKTSKLIKGAVVGAAAGIFFMTALIFALVGCAWLLYYFLPGGDFTYFWGFFAMAVILVLLGVLAGLIAARAVKKGSPPVPSMAFEEARKIRETVSAGPVDAPTAGSPPSPSVEVAAEVPPAVVADPVPLAEAEGVAGPESEPVAGADGEGQPTVDPDDGEEPDSSSTTEDEG